MNKASEFLKKVSENSETKNFQEFIDWMRGFGDSNDKFTFQTQIDCGNFATLDFEVCYQVDEYFDNGSVEISLVSVKVVDDDSLLWGVTKSVNAVELFKLCRDHYQEEVSNSDIIMSDYF